MINTWQLASFVASNMWNGLQIIFYSLKCT